MVAENTGYLPVDDRSNAIQNLATDKLVMKESGYIEIADSSPWSTVDAITDFVYNVMGNILELNRRHSGKPDEEPKYIYRGNQLYAMGSSGSGTIPNDITLNSLTAPGVYTAANSITLNPGFVYNSSFGSTLLLNFDPSSGTPSAQYVYSAAGRLINDNNRGIAMQYNHLGLVTQVAKGSQTLKHTYDATGRKIQTTLPGDTVRNYIDGVEYMNGAIDFISTPQGRIRKNGSNWDYDYFLKDHLGNVRVVFSGGNVMEVNAYYPYGKIISGLSKPNTVAPNAYKYNEKELITAMDLEWLDYGARPYSVFELPVWLTPDRFAEKYYHLSPYQYAANNPINLIDINGDSIWYTQQDNVYTMHVTGKVINVSSNKKIDVNQAASDIASAINSAFSGEIKVGEQTYILQTDIQLEAVTSMDDVASSDHLFVLMNSDGKSARGASSWIGGKVMNVAASDFNNRSNNTRSAVHEFGHATGLYHESATGKSNLMTQSGIGTNVTSEQRILMLNVAHRNGINIGPNSYKGGVPYPYVHGRDFKTGRWDRDSAYNLLNFSKIRR